MTVVIQQECDQAWKTPAQLYPNTIVIRINDPNPASN
jgi:hypothetical protein